MTEIVLATLNARWTHASMGLRCLMANLGALQARARIEEATIATPLDEVLARLLAGSPRMIGLGVYIWNVERTTELVRRLRADATAAIAELGYSGRQGEHMVALFDAPGVRHLVVCTLCSCYPWPVLGLPPVWYKSAPYRSRAVIDPRGVLADFGTTVPDDVELRVFDSTAELRYLVVPMRPAGTDGWSEDALARLVTRDSMIGTGDTLDPTSLEGTR